MKKISYSKDVDIMMIWLSDDDIEYAEDEGDGLTILHYSSEEKLVLIEILDFYQSMSKEAFADFVSVSDPSYHFVTEGDGQYFEEPQHSASVVRTPAASNEENAQIKE